MQEPQAGDPERIGRYRIVGRLGGGGMGRVFLGRSGGGRLLAIKVIRAELAEDPGFRTRFGREVDAARKVSGLFTAPVVDADVDAPMPWLATAYVPGPSLAESVTSNGPLPAGSLLALAAGLAEGLSAIHAAGLVHRDLKPSNVLLADDGPRVIDFGISRATEASALTGTGLVVGSPGFMSPEQAEGHEVGPPSDVFSLGGVLTFAGTGQGPFGTGPTAALLYRVVHNPPATENLPEQMRLLAERCMRKDPQQRPTSAQILSELEDAQPIEGWLPQPVTERLRLHQASGPGDTATGPPALPPPEQVRDASAAPPGISGDPATITTTSARSQPVSDKEHAIPTRRPGRSRVTIFAAIALPLLAAAGAVIALTLPGKSAGTVKPAVAATRQGTVAQAARNPCDDNPASSAVVGSVCFHVPAGYVQGLREPDLMTATQEPNFCNATYTCANFFVLTGDAYEEAFRGTTIGSPAQALGFVFSGPLNIDSFQSFNINPLQKIVRISNSYSCVDARLVKSGTQLLGPRVAEYRQWTYSCPKDQDGSSRELQVWDVPDSKTIVVSYQNLQTGSTLVQAMVATASFIEGASPPVAPPAQISPRSGSVFGNFPRSTKLSWKPVSGATGYLLQIQGCNYYGGCSADPSVEAGTGYVDMNQFPFSEIVDGTTYSFDFVGAEPGRWRVMALRADGELSQFSPWWNFKYTVLSRGIQR